jgi:pyruvate/2-oxoglutarate dehydrogenase complex dihydrolipoamide acyltransferase (E2) component
MPAETSSTTDVTMPQLGVSVVEGTLLRWLVAVGDEVAADQPLCEIDTDKIVTDIPSPAAGRLAEILVPEGTTVEVGTLLARVAGPMTGTSVSDVDSRSTVIWMSTVVRRLAAEHGVDLASVMGTGRGGRVRKQDVLAAAHSDGDRPLHSESPYRPDAEPEPAGSRACGDRSAHT